MAAVCAAGLGTMAASNSLASGIAGYVVFGVAGAVFLSLHSAQTLRVLPRARTRGRDLGLFNLTNTVPSLIMPWLTLALVPIFGFAGLFALLAAMAMLASLLLISVSRPS
jgi:predicted MFS family arabinose efflux permease